MWCLLFIFCNCCLDSFGRKKIKEAHVFGDLVCGVTEQDLLLWSLTKNELVARKWTDSDTSLCLSKSGSFFLAEAGTIHVYSLNPQKDE